MTATKADAKALTAKQSTDNLILGLRMLDTASTAEERLVRSWIITELEERYPAASAAVGAAFDAAEEVVMNDPEAEYPEVDYTTVLINAIREVR